MEIGSIDFQEVEGSWRLFPTSAFPPPHTSVAQPHLCEEFCLGLLHELGGFATRWSALMVNPGRKYFAAWCNANRFSIGVW